MIKRIFILFLICFPVFSQENEYYEANPDENNENIVFVINSFIYNVKGITRPWVLNSKAEIKTGEELTGYSELEDYLKNKTQVLMNERVLESVSIDYTIGEMLPDGKSPVDLVINIKDTWNIIAFPNPQYSTSTGFSISITAWDYNFLGAMQPLGLELGYKYDDFKRSIYFAALDASVPFRTFSFNWVLNTFNLFEYRPAFDVKFHYKNITGLKIQLPHYLKYNPYVSVSFGDISDPSFGFGHKLTYERFNWIDNFREGVIGSISNNFIYSFFDAKNDLNPWNINFILSAAGYGIIKDDFIGVSARLKYRHWLFNYAWEEAGDVMRGIVDKDVQANMMISLNLDFPIRVLRFRPSIWFKNNKLRIANFDLHLVPFIDGAIYRHPDHQTTFGIENLLLSSGIEAVFFPEFFRSLYVRASFGFNLTDLYLKNTSPDIIPGGYSPNARKWELYIGGSFHY